MSARAISALKQAMAALTVEDIEVVSGGLVLNGEDVALLERSIGRDLLRIESTLSARQPTLLSATASSIDEALLMLAEALVELEAQA